MGQSVPADDQNASQTPKRCGRWGKGVVEKKANPDTTLKGDDEGEVPQALTAVQSAIREWEGLKAIYDESHPLVIEAAERLQDARAACDAATPAKAAASHAKGNMADVAAKKKALAEACEAVTQADVAMAAAREVHDKTIAEGAELEA